MPKGTPVDVVGYWFPPDGKGPVGNGLITVLRTAPNPVLAHLFQNYMLDLPNVLTNISFNGYMQPWGRGGYLAAPPAGLAHPDDLLRGGDQPLVAGGSVTMATPTATPAERSPAAPRIGLRRLRPQPNPWRHPWLLEGFTWLYLIWSAIFASAVLVFSSVIDDFVIVGLLYSNAGNTPMSVYIYSQQRGGNGGPALNALGTIMLVMSG